MSEVSQEKIVCRIDGALTHSVQLHIKQHHTPDWTM